ncbi:kinetochore protein mis14 [Purpureocillium lavendulum]|uniref:Kinetochore protein mis14 n=1 Tax=Purpureocillium lavendulum TaxID=1247861 RepID=A0AB34FQ77_9HYPO|nr:kinetochore protein mis14 [Purpureocillium lavendulum]
MAPHHTARTKRGLATMATDPVVAQVQRKIELQSPEDLAYLLANVHRAAAARIDEAFPPVEGAAPGEDRLRNQIEALVNEPVSSPAMKKSNGARARRSSFRRTNALTSTIPHAQYIDRTFSLAAPNLSINGLPVPDSLIASGDPSASQDHHRHDPETAYEPFDTRKRQRIADRTAAEERLLEEVAALKRSVPAAAAAQRAARVREAIDRDDELLRERVAAVSASASAAATADDGPPRVAALPRQDAVEAAFAGAVDALGRLKRDMPAVVAKMERARVAGEYVVTEGR